MSFSFVSYGQTNTDNNNSTTNNTSLQPTSTTTTQQGFSFTPYSSNVVPQFTPSQSALTAIVNMVHNQQALQLLQPYGLTVQNVAWEDNARNKNSAWGPCISDLTLQVEGKRMPLIRQPNFTDVTWDVPMHKIPLVVGNEKQGQQLQVVSLVDYLNNLRTYLNNPYGWTTNNSSLYASQRDSHVIMSAQACFLPVSQGQETQFNVALFNYQSSYDNPAVLAIVATSKGTSAQVITNNSSGSGQLLYFNKNGQKCSFVGQRLSDNRLENHQVPLSTKPMTAEEKQDNMVMVIQVPLKRRTPIYPSNSNFCDLMSFPPSCSTGSSAQNFSFGSSNCNVENAIVKLGKEEGAFAEIPNMPIERDPSFPVRVTLQFYKATDNGVINQSVVSEIATQINQSKANADYVGSLVTAGRTWRPTEPLNTISWNPIGINHINTTPSVKHPNINCDGCKQPMGNNIRFKCLHCPDFDLCHTCEAKLHAPTSLFGTSLTHTPNHLFVKIMDSRPVCNDIHVASRIGNVHHGISCYNCKVSPIVGTRYKCYTCYEVSLCECCEATVGHANRQHVMCKGYSPNMLN